MHRDPLPGRRMRPAWASSQSLWVSGERTTFRPSSQTPDSPAPWAKCPAALTNLGDIAHSPPPRWADHDAVQAGLTRRHRNVQTEGLVTNLKLVRLRGSGRATVDLLSKRVLRAAGRRRPSPIAFPDSTLLSPHLRESRHA